LEVLGTEKDPEFRITEAAQEEQQKLYFDSKESDDGCPSWWSSDHGLKLARPQYLEIHLAGSQTVTAIATQGDKSSGQYVQKYKLSYKDTAGTWRFYSGDDPSSTTLPDASELVGNVDATSVNKNFVKSFEASTIRIHPIRWTGFSMALRAEVYVCLSDFDWDTVVNAVGSLTSVSEMSASGQANTPTAQVKAEDMDMDLCVGVMSDDEVQAKFDAWTLGRGGSGAIYQSEYHDAVTMRGVEYKFTAYQRRSVNDGGLLTKQLICYHRRDGTTNNQQCCVRKMSQPFGNAPWTDQALKTLLA
jgi:hypothetical protein